MTRLYDITPLFSEMINEYIKDKQERWTGKTLLEYQGYFKHLLDVLEVQSIAEIAREELRKVRDTPAAESTCSDAGLQLDVATYT